MIDSGFERKNRGRSQIILKKAKMLLRLTFTVAVVCVGSMSRSVSADAAGRQMVSRDYGVKLCGREFIRAVIFTCGGSRWKRSIDMDLGKLDHCRSFS